LNFWKKIFRFSVGVTVGRVLCFFFSFIFFAACHGIVHGSVHKVMCVGDSITYAYSDPSLRGGYREPLFDLLDGDGFNVEFVGQNIYPSSANPLWGRNEGHSGWTADQIYSGNTLEPGQTYLLDWLSDQTPDTVLLHIGSNDLWGQQLYTEVVDEVMVLVNTIFGFNPSMDVILAQIINQGGQNPAYSSAVFDNREQTSYFNSLLLETAMGSSYFGDNLFVVDQETALTYPDDLLSDLLHPTPGGYDKMAITWHLGVQAAWVPIPGAVWLLGSGLIGIVGVRRKFKI